MSARLPFFFTLYLIVLLSCVFPAAGISIGCSSGGGGESVSSSDTFDLDDSTSLQESISLDFGSISKYRDASGSGNNSMDEYISGTDFSLQNSVQSTGSFGLSSSASATAQSGSLAQDVAGTGSMSISLSSAQGSEQANQGASVTYGALDSVQAIAAGEGVYAAQSTGMAGLEGSILSGAVGSENVMGATGTFTGAGLLEANLAASTSAETGRASASGTADLDGTTLIDSSSFDAVSSQSLGMGLEGLRDVGDGDTGSFDMNVLNLEQEDTAGSLTTQTAALQTAGGSASSYKLTGYKWRQDNPQIQLYLSMRNAPGGVTETNCQAAIAAAANTWDDAVAQNIFADGTTVAINPNVVSKDPSSVTRDGYNVHGWANFGENYLGMCRWWSDGQVKDGYYSIIEADTWYASDKAWTTDLNKATGSTFDLQSVAVHEIGHTIGMGDIYPTSSDFAQVMNSYDGAQRVLGNGDLAGAQLLYGVSSSWGGVAGSSKWISGDLNGDGETDLIRITGEDRIYIGLSNGDGTFTVKPYSPWSGYGTSSGDWIITDVNGDGKADLEHIWGGDYINTWLSNGDGTFTVKPYSPWSGYGTSSGNWKIMDVNGDGKADLEHIWGGDYINTWLSNGDGTFTVKPYSPWSGYGTSSGNWKIMDVNGDGKADLEHIWGGDYINTWLSNGDGTFTVKPYSPWSGYGTTSGNWKIMDVNGDGKADLEHIWGGDYINAWLSNGDGTFTVKPYSPWSGYGTSSGDWIITDVNGDGKADLEHIWGGDYINAWLSNGDGTFTVKPYSPWSGYGTSSGDWIITDVNGDGKADLEHIWGGDYINTWLSNGDGTFTVKPYSPWSGYNTKTGIWYSANINADSADDLIQLLSGNTVYSWISNGDGTFHVVATT